MLLFHEGAIVQYLEGPRAGVISTRDRFATDPRHTGVLKLSEGPVEHRLFGDWSMEFRLDTTLPELQSFHFDLEALDARLPESTPLMMRKIYETAR